MPTKRRRKPKEQPPVVDSSPVDDAGTVEVTILQHAAVFWPDEKSYSVVTWSKVSSKIKFVTADTFELTDRNGSYTGVVLFSSKLKSEVKAFINKKVEELDESDDGSVHSEPAEKVAKQQEDSVNLQEQASLEVTTGSTSGQDDLLPGSENQTGAKEMMPEDGSDRSSVSETQANIDVANREANVLANVMETVEDPVPDDTQEDGSDRSSISETQANIDAGNREANVLANVMDTVEDPVPDHTQEELIARAEVITETSTNFYIEDSTSAINPSQQNQALLDVSCFNTNTLQGKKIFKSNNDRKEPAWISNI